MVKFVMTAFLVAAMASAPKPTEILEKVDTAVAPTSSSTATPGHQSPPAFSEPPTPSPDFEAGKIIPGVQEDLNLEETRWVTPRSREQDLADFGDNRSYGNEPAEGGDDYNYESYPDFEEDGQPVADLGDGLASPQAVEPKEEEEGSEDEEDKEEEEDSDGEDEDDDEGLPETSTENNAESPALPTEDAAGLPDASTENGAELPETPTEDAAGLPDASTVENFLV